MKFFSRNRYDKVEFDFKTFKDVIETVIMAQDIVIDNSSYPSETIAENTKKYRSLGLGFTNLGGLLMYIGLPYDSEEGRHLAAGLTALMTGIAFRTSADLAEKVGEFSGFEANKSPMGNVLKQHINEVYKLFSDDASEGYWQIIKENCYEIWNSIKYVKGFRNAQVTLLAPTGTTSFIMNSVTTGIEPEYSLIRYKRLAGSDGATLKTVNPIVEESLKNLGYSKEEIPRLIKELTDDYSKIKDEDLEKTNFKDNRHREIFLTAAPTPGTDLCIPYMGHVKMCAAVQPFLSGAISKTINLPKEATVDDIYNLYIEAWKMGLKGITIYRDGSKNFQPLSSSDNKEDIKKSEPARAEKLVRIKMPDERPAITHKFRIGSSEGYITCGMYPNSHKLGEIFVNVSKEGSVISGFADALATVMSISLQYGVPLKDLVRKLTHLKFEPNGFTTNPDIRIAHSIVDYVAKYIGLKFLPKEEQIELGLIQAKDTNGILLEKESINLPTHDQDVGPSCPNCASIMRRLGSCYLCSNCAYNQGACG